MDRNDIRNKLSPLINDGMIIQRNASFPIRTQEKASVSFLGKTYESAEKDGKWLIMLDPLEAGGPFSMEIQIGDEKIKIDDIYAGDVWLCAGQSNMEMEMSQLRKLYNTEWDEAEKKQMLIRHFRTPKEWDFDSPRSDISGGNWKTASKESLGEFSAVAYFYAKYIYEKYKIPIGLVNASWGGTPVEAWMSREALKNYPEKIEYSENCRSVEFRAKEFEESGYMIAEKEYLFAQKPIGNFNAMIYPLLKFSYKGVIWYQGESNDSAPEDYSSLFKSMIQDWRKLNLQLTINSKQKNEDEILPFFFVQLPVWKEASDNNQHSAWAMLREAQASALELPNTGMACALELGMWDDIHPVNKKDVGYRLFLAMEKVLHNVNNSSPGPVIREQRIVNSENKILIFFDNCAEGLIKKEETAYVCVIGSKGYKRLPAEIERKDCISIDYSSIINPRMILYAWADNPKDRQLFNSDGLPVIPFKIDL